jgi:cobalt-zinc-cadmium resistance protein CzcA
VLVRRRGRGPAGAALLLAARLGSEFVPRLREGAIVINTVRWPASRVDESVRYGTQIERAAGGVPRRDRARLDAHRHAEVATDPMGLELSDVFITLKPRERWTKARRRTSSSRRCREAVADLPGMRAAFMQPIEMRVNEMVAGSAADVGVKLFGDDLDAAEGRPARSRRC